MTGRPPTAIERRVRRLEQVLRHCQSRRREARRDVERARKALWAAKRQYRRETGEPWGAKRRRY